MAKRKAIKSSSRRRPTYGSQSTCLEDPDNDLAQVSFVGRAFQLRTWGFPVAGFIERLVDGDIEGSTIDEEPPSGTANVDSYTSGNGNWSHSFHAVQCEPGNLPSTDIVIKNFIVWWKYQKGSNPVQTHWLTEIIRVPMQPCMHLGLCPTAVKKAPKAAKSKTAKKKSKK